MVLVRVGTNHVCRSPSSPPNVPIARSRGTANSIATSTRAARTDTTLLRALSGSRGQNGVLTWLRWRWTQITTAAGLQLRKMAAAVTAPPRRRPRRPRPRRTRRRPPRRPRRSAAAWPPRFPTPPRSHHSRAAPHTHRTTPLLTRGRGFLMLVAIPQARIARASVLLIVAPSRKRAPRAHRRAIAVCARAVAGTYTHPHTRDVMA